MRFRAALFDLDGTLLDTLQDLAGSMNSVLQQFGYPEHPAEAYKLMVGNGMETLVRRALPPAIDDRTVLERAIAGMEAEYQTRWNRLTKPYAGVPEMLDGLAGRGLPLTILSNKPHPFTLLTVDALLGNWHFTQVFGARPGIPKKPDPGQAVAIATALGIPPAEFVYLGDSGVDMQTAAEAGMFGVGVLWGFRGAEELERHGARRLLAQPADLFSLLE